MSIAVDQLSSFSSETIKDEVFHTDWAVDSDEIERLAGRSYDRRRELTIAQVLLELYRITTIPVDLPEGIGGLVTPWLDVWISTKVRGRQKAFIEAHEAAHVIFTRCGIRHTHADVHRLALAILFPLPWILGGTSATEMSAWAFAPKWAAELRLALTNTDHLQRITGSNFF